MTEREYLYTVLMEECAELIQTASKILRFGEKGFNPFDENIETNEEALLKEFAHVRAAITMLQERGFIDRPKDAKEIGMLVAKEEKVKHYLKEFLEQQEFLQSLDF